MPKSSFINFRAIKAAITMEQVFEHYGILETFKRIGDSLTGPCPIHKGTNTTQFRVSLSKNIWNCFGQCKKGGNVLDFIALLDSVSVHAAASKSIEWFHLDTEAMTSKSREEAEAPNKQSSPTSVTGRVKEIATQQVPAQQKVSINPPLKFKLDKLDPAHPYLISRGLTTATISEFGLGYCNKGIMADRIAIPIRNASGELVAYAGRCACEPSDQVPKYRLPNGFHKSMELFNIERCLKEPAENPLVIVEGFFDCMFLHQNGWRKVVALMGSSMSVAQEDLIRRHSNKGSQVVVMLDEDESGRLGREDIALRLAKFVFVRIHTFDQVNTQPEHLNAEQVSAALEGL